MGSRCLRFAVLLVPLWLAAWGCELWGYHCQDSADCSPLQRCVLGFCQARSQEPAGDASEPDGPSDGFRPQSCPCSIPSCTAATEGECSKVEGCGWKQIPPLGGPFLCVVDRAKACTDSQGTWHESLCKCPQGRRLYAGLLCLAEACTGGCQDPHKGPYFADPSLAQARAQALQRALVRYLESIGTIAAEWLFLKDKTVGTPLSVEHRRIHSNAPLRWSVEDRDLLVPLRTPHETIDTWLVLRGADATLKEIVNSPPVSDYPIISAKRALATLQKRIKGPATAHPIQAVAISRKDGLTGIKTLQLFPLWRFVSKQHEYFVTTYTQLHGEPLVYRSMGFVYLPAKP